MRGSPSRDEGRVGTLRVVRGSKRVRLKTVQTPATRTDDSYGSSKELEKNSSQLRSPRER